MIHHRRLRTVSASALIGLYRPGKDITRVLGGGTHSRADATTCARQFDVDGIAQLAAANVLRDGHYIGGVRTTLLEPARDNRVYGSSVFAGATQWVNGSPLTLAEATSCLAGEVAGKQTCTGAGNQERHQNIEHFVNARRDCLSVIVENVDVTNTLLVVHDVTQAGGVGRVRFEWPFHSAFVTAGTAQFGYRDLGNGRWLFWNSSLGTASGVAADGHVLAGYIYPADLTVSTKSMIIHHAELNLDAAYPTSPIVTGAGPVARAVDALAFAGVAAPNEATLYERYFDLATNAWADSASAYASGAAITPAVGRAYTDIGVFPRTLTAAQARHLLGYSS